MKTKRILSALPLWLGLLLFTVPVTSEAQFLKKLGQGLEKVNKGLEKVNKGLDKMKNGELPTLTPKSQKKQTETSTTAPTTSTTAPATATTSTAAASTAPDRSKWKTVEPTYPTPFISANTKYLRLPDLYDNTVGDVHEGVFSVKKNYRYEFWRVTGKRLYADEWEHPESSYNFFPYFNSGVCPMVSSKPAADGKKRWHLLYLDGSVKELDPTYKEITHFSDGLAIVKQTVNYKDQYFYINVRGEKAFPNLRLNGDADDAMRPLCNGLRAFREYKEWSQEFRTLYAWGYMDANGKVVIPATYMRATNFSEGYAWVVKTLGEPQLIDKTGKVVFAPGKYDYYSDVVNGKFYIQRSNSANLEYYDITGKKLAEFNNGMPFYDGYAFVEVDVDGGNDGVKLINNNCEIVRHFSFDDFVAYNLDRMKFSPLGTVVYSDMNDASIRNNKGDVLISVWDGEGYDRISGFRNFTADGYAVMTNIQMNNKRYKGIINTTAELEWLFSTEEYTKDWGDWPIDPEPEPDDSAGFNDPIPEPVPPTDGPEGPKVRQKQKYNVTVKCEPAKGGSASITPAKVFEYGDMATLTAKANKDWAVARVTSDTEGYAVPNIGEPFAVTTDMTLTVHFLEKDTTETPQHTTALQGTRHKFIQNEDWSMDTEIYAEISEEPNISSPYGEKTYGFITAMVDPDRLLEMPEFTAHIFTAPLEVCGYQFDQQTNRRWMVLEGGAFAIGNLQVHPEGNGMMGLYFTALLALNNHTDFQILPRRYRLEMLDYNTETGEFTCGAMQTFSAEWGWLNSDDKRLAKKEKGFMMTATDNGLPGDLFQGAKLKVAPKRNDVHWYPSAKWYKEDQNALQQAIESLNKAYRSLETDYQKVFGE